MPSTHGADLLILAAHPLELAGFSAVLGSNAQFAVADVRVTCATIGVGLLAAAAGAALRLRDVQPRAVLLVGSCGIYPKRPFVPLQPVIPAQISLLEPYALVDEAEFPAPMVLSHATHLALSEGLASHAQGALRGALGTTLSITTDDEAAHALGDLSDCDAENLEASAVASACAEPGLPFTCLTIATNAVGSRGREQWRAHHASAAERAARIVLDWLEQRAPGLSRA
jgi:nucleoside phosphorylase